MRDNKSLDKMIEQTEEEEILKRFTHVTMKAFRLRMP